MNHCSCLRSEILEVLRWVHTLFVKLPRYVLRPRRRLLANPARVASDKMHKAISIHWEWSWSCSCFVWRHGGVFSITSMDWLFYLTLQKKSAKGWRHPTNLNKAPQQACRDPGDTWSACKCVSAAARNSSEAVLTKAALLISKHTLWWPRNEQHGQKRGVSAIFKKTRSFCILFHF